MLCRICLYIVLLVVSHQVALAQVAPIADGGKRGISVMDTLSNAPDTEYVYPQMDPSANNGGEKFYDSLESKARKNVAIKFIYDFFIRRPKRDTTLQGRWVDEAQEIERYAGRTIGDININRYDVFEKAKSVVQKSANSIHVITREAVIRQDLFIKPGDVIVPDEIVRNNHLLRSRRYISNLWMEFVPRDEDSTIVDINIATRDSWTIG